MASTIVLAIFYTSALFAVVWLVGGVINYQRFVSAKQRRDQFMLWFVVGPVGPMLFAYTGWEERHKLHGPVLDAAFDRLRRRE